jgi:hypothetical protein
MLRPGVGDHADGRACDTHQRRDFSAPIRAHLHHGKPMGRVDPQQGQRYANVVVEIAAGREAIPELPENGGGHFLGRRFAIAAGNAHYRKGELLAPAVARALECRLSVGDDDLGKCHGLLAIDERARRAGGQRGPDKLVAVEIRSTQSDKQGALPERARVGGNSRVGTVRPLEAAATQLREIGERVHTRRPSSVAVTIA